MRTALKEWTQSRQRTEYLLIWIVRYNYIRPHSALGRKTPASKLSGG
ncbi:integrase core domain-containing protein [Bilophila wadsworthia]